ncbi:hypothetical protein RB195_025811 [Necator americanus]|uniref:7TM chemoreceptor n=1 Tax=Necator americanus TaxID=51031 RepID=A0ABR1EU00_NECAM
MALRAYRYIELPDTVDLRYSGHSVLIGSPPPKTLRVYRVFLANVALGDLLFSAATTFAQIRIIPNKWAFAYVSLGPAAYFGSHVSYLAYCVQLHALFYTFLSFPLSFGFRYYVLIKSMPKIKNCIPICVGLWLVAFAQHVIFIYSETDPAFIREYLSINKPEYNLTDFVISGNHMIKSPLTVVTLSTIVLPMFPIYLLVIFFYRRVHAFLRCNAGKMREGTVKGHKLLIQALIIQASLPLLFIFPPILIYGFYHLELINFTIIEYLVYVIFSFYPATSPLVTLYFVRPFNNAVRRLLGIHLKVSDASKSEATAMNSMK